MKEHDTPDNIHDLGDLGIWSIDTLIHQSKATRDHMIYKQYGYIHSKSTLVPEAIENTYNKVMNDYDTQIEAEREKKIKVSFINRIHILISGSIETATLISADKELSEQISKISQLYKKRGDVIANYNKIHNILKEDNKKRRKY